MLPRSHFLRSPQFWLTMGAKRGAKWDAPCDGGEVNHKAKARLLTMMAAASDVKKEDEEEEAEEAVPAVEQKESDVPAAVEEKESDVPAAVEEKESDVPATVEEKESAVPAAVEQEESVAKDIFKGSNRTDTFEETKLGNPRFVLQSSEKSKEPFGNPRNNLPATLWSEEIALQISSGNLEIRDVVADFRRRVVESVPAPIHPPDAFWKLADLELFES